MVLFCENSLQFTVVNNFDRKQFSDLLRGAESALRIFSDLHLLKTFFLLLTFLNVNGT